MGGVVGNALYFNTEANVNSIAINILQGIYKLIVQLHNNH